MAVHHKPVPTARRRQRAGVPVEVCESGEGRALLLGTDTVQSLMNVGHPAELVLSYTRAMMGGLLFYRQPKRILHIGLGGGSLLRFCYEHLPESVHTVVELHAEVVAAARQWFELPEEGERLTIHVMDGVAFMAQCEQQFDLILVDAFDGVEIVADTVREPFLHDCRQALSAEGVLSLNFWRKDPFFERRFQTVTRVFEGWAFQLPATTHGNVAILAMRPPIPSILRLDRLATEANTLTAQCNIEFDAFVSRLKAENPHTAQRLLPRQ